MSLAASDSVRTSSMVMTMVSSTTSVAPKVRARSRLSVLSNNMDPLCIAGRIMDFKIQVTELKDLRHAEADALLLVVGEGSMPESLGKALGGALTAALQDG